MLFDDLAHAFADWLHRHPGVGGWTIALLIGATATNLVAGVWHRATRDTKTAWIKRIHVGRWGIGAAFLSGASAAGFDPIGVLDFAVRVFRWIVDAFAASRGIPDLTASAVDRQDDPPMATGEDRITLTTTPPSDPPPPPRIA